MKEESEDLKAIQEEVSKIIEFQNSAPNPEIDNLSPIDLHQILYNTFGEESPIGFKNEIPEEVFSKIPFLLLIQEYLLEIEKSNELKLTAKGNLPRKICLELYNKEIIKEDYIESGIVKLSKEADSVVLQNLKIISDFSGLTKKRNNKISLTQKGKKLIKRAQGRKLFEELFITNYRKFNIGFHDGYSDEVGVQKTFGFTLYLLLQYGDKKRSLEFYANKQISAFPFELGHFESDWSTLEKQYQNCLGVRIFERFLAYYNLVDYNHNVKFKERENLKLNATQIFFEIFELKPDKFKFRKSKHFA